jgi:hypothetical protein
MDKDNIFLAHLMRYVFPEFRTDTESSIITRWVLTTRQPNNHAQTPQLAVSALAAAHFGKVHRRQQAIERQMMLYTQVLRQIRRDLCDSARILDSETLASTLLLAVYELISSEHSTAVWLISLESDNLYGLPILYLSHMQLTRHI